MGILWARFMIRRNLTAVGGIRTANRASHALLEATRWLTGQIPEASIVAIIAQLNDEPLTFYFVENVQQKIGTPPEVI
jgi:hypothetical protein